ncbi:phosphoesterase PA-phosphatase [Nonomuraea aridisoli]|uniref:Phosphoesterase PA-phosphatase n=2 Tax=Nonomuraea aridisoli TaxID=2070368 RepID=A0A2W2EX91_9ACTN|nr:phosphoesterase PA-phosphatase [Nonomuraea aridisoli]
MLLMAGLTYGLGEAIFARLAGEAELNRALAAGRTPLWNDLTDVPSSLSDTPYIVALTALAAVVFRFVHRRWRESIFLIAAVWSQSLVFLATTGAVGRRRPPVPHLDEAPPTSSFPSGHVSAAVAFYCGVALVLTARVRSPALRVVIWALAAAVPPAVAFARVYRGMHFLSDVLWGLLLGTACVVMAARAFLRGRAARTAGSG